MYYKRSNKKKSRESSSDNKNRSDISDSISASRSRSREKSESSDTTTPHIKEEQKQKYNRLNRKGRKKEKKYKRGERAKGKRVEKQYPRQKDKKHQKQQSTQNYQRRRTKKRSRDTSIPTPKHSRNTSQQINQMLALTENQGNDANQSEVCITHLFPKLQRVHLTAPDILKAAYNLTSFSCHCHGVGSVYGSSPQHVLQRCFICLPKGKTIIWSCDKNAVQKKKQHYYYHHFNKKDNPKFVQHRPWMYLLAMKEANPQNWINTFITRLQKVALHRIETE